MAFRKQADIIKLLVDNFPKSTLVTILTEALKVAKPTAYKYINENVDISYDQMNKLLQHRLVLPILYQNSLTSSSNIIWNYPVFDQPQMDAKTYIQNINNFLSLFKDKEVELRYTSYEVPLFYYMYYPDLFAFKLYTWSKTIWQTPGFENAKFKPELILTDEIMHLINDTLSQFSELASVEYWTDQLFDNTIRQLHFFRQMEYIQSMTLCKKVAADILRLIRLMRVMATSGKKFRPNISEYGGDITIYKNEIYYTNNIVSVKSADQTVTFCAFDNPNFIITMDQKLGQRTADWIDHMQSGCTRLTQNSDLVRLEFFRTMEHKLEILDFDFENI